MDDLDCLGSHMKNIRKKVVKNGRPGRKPSDLSVCQCNVQNLGMADVSSKYVSDNPVFVTLGAGEERIDIEIEYCLESMQVEEESEFSISTSSEDTVNVMIYLISCERKPYIFQWSEEDKLNTALQFKAQGVQLFNKQETQHAFFKFSKALKLLLLCDCVENNVLGNADLLVNMYNNLANCQLQFNNYEFVVQLCTKSLTQMINTKALYRRALAYSGLKQYELAEKDLSQVLELEPSNRAALNKLKLVHELNSVSKESYISTIKNMFK